MATEQVLARMIGQRMKRAREHRNYTQPQLAAAIGTTPSLISQYENGHVRPTAVLIRPIAPELNVDANWLLGLMDGFDPPDLPG